MIWKLNNKGLTFVEIMVSIAIFTLISAVAVDLLINIYPRKGNILSEQLSTQSETRKVIDEFENEIRGATYSSIGSYPLAEASTTEIIFYSNPNASSLRQRIRYFLDGTIMKKGVVTPNPTNLTYDVSTETITEVMHGVVPTTTIFTYYDSSYTGSEDPMSQPVQVGKVRMVGIKVTIDRDPFNSPTQFTTESKAIIRNLMYN